VVAMGSWRFGDLLLRARWLAAVAGIGMAMLYPYIRKLYQ
jgi:hypothetical protein